MVMRIFFFSSLLFPKSVKLRIMTLSMRFLRPPAGGAALGAGEEKKEEEEEGGGGRGG
jgi:hypothetical protein